MARRLTTCDERTYQRIVAQLPPDLVQAMARVGWNALGIANLVRRERARTRRLNRKELSHD